MVFEQEVLQKCIELCKGKTKILYATADPDYGILKFRDDPVLERTGRVRHEFNHFLMQKLIAAGIPTHFQRFLSEDESLVKRLDMIPIQCVIRNIASSSLRRRLGVEEGIVLNPPTFEFFLKNGTLEEPMVNEHLIHSFGWATMDEILRMKMWSYQANSVLKALFAEAGWLLVDFKLQFGRLRDSIVLGDEVTIEAGCVWEIGANEKSNKKVVSFDRIVERFIHQKKSV